MAWTLAAEIFEAQAEGDHARAMGLNAVWMQVLEEVARRIHLFLHQLHVDTQSVVRDHFIIKFDGVRGY